jgi:hypothetical protein
MKTVSLIIVKISSTRNRGVDMFIQNKTFKFYALVISCLVLITGCSSTPSVHNHTVDVSDAENDLIPAKEIVDAKIGIYYEPQTENYIHEQAFSDSIATMNVGEASVELFSKAIPMTFREVERLSEMPPYDLAKSDYDGIIEPRIDYVNWRTGFESQDEYYHVEYTFILYTNTGVPLSMWRVRGDGKYLDDQIKDAAQKFVSGFSTARETESFRSYLSSKDVREVKFDSNNIDIKTEIIDENPLGFELIASGILPVKVKVTNNTGYAVTGRGYDVRLIYGDNDRLPPAFPLAVISSTEYLNVMSKSDPAVVAGFLGPLAVLPVMAGQSADQQDERKARVEYFNTARLKEHTLQNGESIEGKLFFKVPADVQSLEDVKLSFWFIDKAANNGSRKTIDVSGVDYRKLTPEELKVKAAQIKTRQEALEPGNHYKEEQDL